MYRLTLAAFLLVIGASCNDAPKQLGKCTFEGFNVRRGSEVEIRRKGQPYLTLNPDSTGQVAFTLPRGADCKEFEAFSEGVRGKRIE
jgi:hypothetical protein